MRRFFTSSLLSMVLLLGLVGTAVAEPVKVLMKTNHGNITLELYPDKAPKTVKNFLRYVDEGFYNNTIFHRVIYDFMIQGGGFGTDFKKKKTHAPVRNEADNGLKNTKGTVAMARTSEPHSATAQFFINHKNNGFLNFRSKNFQGWGYTVFGKVVGGMQVTDKIAEQPTLISHPKLPGARDIPKQMIVIQSIERM